MKNIVLKLAFYIIKKYGSFSPKVGDQLVVNDRVYIINKLKTSKEYFKHDLIIEASDIIPFPFK